MRVATPTFIARARGKQAAGELGQWKTRVWEGKPIGASAAGITLDGDWALPEFPVKSPRIVRRAKDLWVFPHFVETPRAVGV